jgi:predicted nucleic acid-binding protein
VSGYVVDASAMLGWLFKDEQQVNADDILDRLVEGGLLAPGHWAFELSNVLLMAERRGRVTANDITEFMVLLSAIEITLDPIDFDRVWISVRDLARRYRLTVYDAAYLELAQRVGATLVSKDRALLVAAEAAGVGILAV